MDGNGRPKMPGAINGGFYPKTPDMPAQYPSIVIAVDDIHESMAKVTAGGGKVLGEPVEIPMVGQYVSLIFYNSSSVSFFALISLFLMKDYGKSNLPAHPQHLGNPSGFLPFRDHFNAYFQLF
jgi:hypothetical protein